MNPINPLISNRKGVALLGGVLIGAFGFLFPAQLHASDEDVSVLELAPGLIVPLANPKPIDWETIGAEELLSLFLSQLRSDPSDELEYRREAMRMLCAGGEFDLASSVAQGVRQDERAEILAELGAALVEADRSGEGAKRLEEAETWLPHASGIHQDTARRHLGVGHARLRRLDDAREWLDSIRDPFEKERLRGEIVFHCGEPAEIEAFLANDAEPFVLPQVGLLIRLGADDLRDGNLKAANVRFKEAGKRAFGLKKPSGFASVAPIVDLLIEHDALEEATWHLEAYLRGVRTLADEMPEKCTMLARAAGCARELGKVDLAEAMLEAAEENIKNVFVLYASKPLCELARIREETGDHERRRQLIDIAVRTSAAYDHVRGRAMGAVWVCLFYHLTGLPMEASVREQLRLAAGA